MIRGIFNSLAMGIAVLAMHGASADTLITSTVTSVYPLSSGAFIITVSDDVPSYQSTLSPKQFQVQVGMNGVTEASLRLIYAASLVAVAGAIPSPSDSMNPRCSATSIACRFSRTIERIRALA